MNQAQNRAGAGVIGWMCGYVPEEIILAAGLESVRIRGAVPSLKQADSYLFPNFCPYVKNVFDSGLRGEYGNLSGIIFTNSCDAMRRLRDLWDSHVKTPFSFMLEVPRNRDEDAVTYFSEQLAALQTQLENFIGAKISRDSLQESIRVMNEQRALMAQLLERQKAKTAALEGSELLAFCLEAMTSPKEAFTKKLEKILAQSPSVNSGLNQQPRVLVVGSVMDRLDLLEKVEAAGASVVAFDTCAGLRHWSGLVQEGENAVHSLARRYLLKPPCPRMPGFERRIEQIIQFVRDYSVDGVIYSAVKFCDYGLFEAPVIEAELRNQHVPFMMIENDYVFGDMGRIGVRLEAFVEMMKGDVD
ncbi:MAG: 2-hydroxyacyl-CoA dehydratase [Deltaproteobacteria bacterium]|nr:2-hydroxyacyl-CoA dehydratase [Deltaproteobacteria bacterium]